MRNALTLLELIFTLLIIGILIVAGSQNLHTSFLNNDTSFITSKIIQAQYKAQGIDHRDENGDEIANDSISNIGCIKFTKEALDDSANSSKANYKIHASLSGELANKKLCFDQIGRPSLNDHLHPIKTTKDLILSYQDRNRTIIIYPQSGYVIIKD